MPLSDNHLSQFIGNMLPHIVSLLFRSLTSRPEAAVDAAYNALKEILSLSANVRRERRKVRIVCQKISCKCVSSHFSSVCFERPLAIIRSKNGCSSSRSIPASSPRQLWTLLACTESTLTYLGRKRQCGRKSNHKKVNARH